MTIGASFFPLDAVIAALITTRILVQFIAQIQAVDLLRRRRASVSVFRMALYPIPSAIAIAGWTFIYVTTDWVYLAGGSASLAAGVAAYAAWSWWRSREGSTVPERDLPVGDPSQGPAKATREDRDIP